MLLDVRSTLAAGDELLPTLGKRIGKNRDGLANLFFDASVQAELDRESAHFAELSTAAQRMINRSAELQIFDLLKDRFDLNEIQDICYYLDVDFDELEGMNKSYKIRELLSFLRRRNRLHDLIELGKTLRKDVIWP